MKKGYITAALRLLLLAFAGAAFPLYGVADEKKEDTMTLHGHVVESFAHQELLGSKVFLLDSLGAVIDSLTIKGGAMYGDGSGVMKERAFFSFKVPKRDATYGFEVIHDDYSPYAYTYRLENIGKREFGRSLPKFVLTRAPKQLGEVTVTASKIKFYHKGDTLVYNADAFDLAEGSMLDALVKQLPGVEIREGGQIYVNGEFVENLLLNGKEFFNNNKELMLDNLPAYTVKDVQVYRRTTDEDKWMGLNNAKELVMDVKLKKEYNVGWIMNFEAGIGTSERYMGRAFINRFDINSRVSLIGNINNLNDSRKPGETSTWTPQSNTTGTMKTQLGALDYYFHNKAENRTLNGSVMVRHTSQHDTRMTDRLNFLPDGTRPAEYTYNNARTRSFEVSTEQRGRISTERVFNTLNLTAAYSKTNSDHASIGGAFREEQTFMSSGLLDSIYTGDHDAINALINRTRTATRSSGHTANGSFSYNGSLRIGHAADYLRFQGDISMSDSKSEVWRDYVVNYGSNPTPSLRQNQYFDNSPNRNISFSAGTSYLYSLGENTSITLGYNFTHSDSHKDSYMYALDRLSDLGIIGTLPEGYLTTLDASRSYVSHTVENRHKISLSIYKWDFNEKFSFSIQPSLQIIDRNFDYLRAATNHHVDQKHALIYVPDYSTQIYLRLGEMKSGGRKSYRHTFNLRLMNTPTIPDPVKMVDIADTNDPMNIWLGNPGLKPSNKMEAKLVWNLTAPIGERPFYNFTEISYAYTLDALVNGFSFDETTGVRTNKTYNVHTGNYTAKIHVSPSFQFGSKGQFSANYFGGLDYLHSADMVGQNGREPVPTTVYTWWQVHTASFSWQLGKQQLSFRGQINGRHTGSERENFTRINALTTTLTLSGQFRLPKGFGISTDFNLYTRSGYGTDLDKTDPVWNARVSYAPPKTSLVLMLDGFDMLHRLSNVNYTIDDQGRTITYTNVLPRYFMFHVQYKLNVHPKRKLPTVREYY